jgi:5-formyltetrahydrofolate cyclo-ligase
MPLSKSELRMKLAAKRTSIGQRFETSPLDAQELANMIAHRFLSLPTTAAMKRVAAYANVGGEPPTDVIRTELRKNKCEVWLPYAESTGEMRWLRDTGDELTPGPMGIPAPVGEFLTGGLEKVEAVVVPALAVTRSGARLGRGGGYYDRALAKVARYQDGGPMRIALVYDDEIVESLPSESHDERVDAIVTPRVMFMVEA